MNDDSNSIMVIGAGVIGTAIAHELQTRGRQVVLIDRDAPGRGASFGNMASIAVTEFMPASRPAIWRQMPGWLLDPEGPVRVRPSYMPRLIPWFARFLAASRPAKVLTEAYYWDLNDNTRAFAKRFAEKMPGRVPSQSHAGAYAATLHYLKAVAALKSKDGKAVVDQMKKTRTSDVAFGEGYIREDGRKMHPVYLFEVKSPAESKGPWDYYKLVAEIPAEQAFRPISKGGCPLVKL